MTTRRPVDAEKVVVFAEGEDGVKRRYDGEVAKVKSDTIIAAKVGSTLHPLVQRMENGAKVGWCYPEEALHFGAKIEKGKGDIPLSPEDRSRAAMALAVARKATDQEGLKQEQIDGSKPLIPGPKGIKDVPAPPPETDEHAIAARSAIDVRSVSRETPAPPPEDGDGKAPDAPQASRSGRPGKKSTPAPASGRGKAGKAPAAKKTAVKRGAKATTDKAGRKLTPTDAG